MHVSIIIPTLNHLDDCLKPCLESIVKNTTMNGEVEVIVVANGCTDGTKDYVQTLSESYPDGSFRLVWFDEPMGYTKATNEGIRVARGNYIVLLNNDTVILDSAPNTWINMLIGPLADTKIAMTGPMEAYSPEAEANFLIFFCVCARREMFELIGELDEIFSPGFGEDTDWCMRAVQAGYKLLQVPDYNVHYHPSLPTSMIGGFPIWHKGEQTMVEVAEVDGRNDLLRKNRNILRSKYHSKIKLNLGCGTQKIDGYIGVDMYDEAGANTGADLRLDVRDLSYFKNDSVEEIMGIHIFEHLSPYEVGDVLREWKRVLKPGGKLVLEMPDIKELCRQFEGADKFGRYRILNCIYGTTQIAHGHLFGWYDEILFDHLAGVGFENVQFLPPQFEHWGFNMRVEATKPVPVFQPVASPPTTEEIKEKLETANSTFSNVLANGAIRSAQLAKKEHRIFDCFTFFNELEILDIRLNELDHIVDKFVLVEANKTHSGHPKPLYFEENKHRFERFLHKIEHVVVEDFPEGDSWVRERWQRDAIMRGLKDCVDKDIVVISDADEIPRAESLVNYKPEYGLMILDMPLYLFYLNYKGDRWDQAKILNYELLKMLTPCGARYMGGTLLANGGWHFSYLGGTERVITKIEAWAHQEYNKPEFKTKENIERSIERGVDPFGRGLTYRMVPLDGTFPQYVVENAQEFIAKGFIKQ
jgi:beta-1,4-mannosyl-glycoprotein beta-1,4-N-acetylglucosaminyltransferase